MKFEPIKTINKYWNGLSLATKIAIPMVLAWTGYELHQANFDRNLDLLERLADYDRSGYLDSHEMKEMYEACEETLVLTNGVPTKELTNKQVKKGLEKYMVRYLINNL
jgi:ABC-type sugar transport system ATPase subunit